MNHQENEVSLFYTSLSASTDHTSDEVLVADNRTAESPAQIVERKLVSILQDGQVLVSHLQARRARCPSA